MRYLLLIIFLLAACQPEQAVTIGGNTMGTTYHITIFPSEGNGLKANRLQVSIDSLLEEVNDQMSTYRPNSEITRFNKLHSTEPFMVSKAFMRVLKSALGINKQSNGAFDVTVGPLVNLWGFGTKGDRSKPPTDAEIKAVRANVGSHYLEILNDTTIRKTNPNVVLDFSAIAKGYGVDVVAGLLREKGYQNFLTEIGGEIVTRGSKQGIPWKIGIDRPEPGIQPGSNLQHILNLKDGAMATSGDYRNFFMSGDSMFSHEIDPVSGRSIVTGVASVTILAADCMTADAMATAIMVMGAEKGMDWIEHSDDTEGLIILHDGNGFRELHSSGFNSFIEKR